MLAYVVWRYIYACPHFSPNQLQTCEAPGKAPHIHTCALSPSRGRVLMKLWPSGLAAARADLGGPRIRQLVLDELHESLQRLTPQLLGSAPDDVHPDQLGQVLQDVHGLGVGVEAKRLTHP